MVTIFYKSDAQVFDTTNLEILQRLRTSDVLWIDMYDLEGEEKRAVEAFLGTKLQTRAQAEEIESSSRFSETALAFFLTAITSSNFPFRRPHGKRRARSQNACHKIPHIIHCVIVLLDHPVPAGSQIPHVKLHLTHLVYQRISHQISESIVFDDISIQMNMVLCLSDGIQE